MRRLVVLAVWALASPPIAVDGAVTGVKWNKGRQNFEPIPGLRSQEAERREQLLLSRQEETHVFNGEPMIMSYYEDPGFYNLYDNDTKVRGICGDFWNILSEFLNFTLVVNKSAARSVGFKGKNGSFSGILGHAGLNEIDIVPKMGAYSIRLEIINFSPVLWMNRQRIYARARWNPNRHWMFDLYSVKSWCLITVFVWVLSLASLVTERVSTERSGQSHLAESYFVHLFYTFSTLCNQGNASDNVGRGSRILNLTVRLFAWLTLVGYSSRLIDSLTQEVFIASFTDLPSLLKKTKIQLLVLEGSFSETTFFSPFADQIFRDIKKASRVSVEKTLDDLYRKVCVEPDKYVLVDEEDAMATRTITLCKLVPVGKAYYLTPIVSGMSKRVKHKKTTDIGIMKLREFGLLDAIIKRYASIRVDESTIKKIDNLVIDINRVSFIIALLCIGIVLSAVICVAENIAYTVLAVRTQATITKK